MSADTSLPEGQLHLRSKLHAPAGALNCKRPDAKHLVFCWWGRTDSNHRSETQQIYSLSPLATRELPHIQLARIGAGRRTRSIKERLGLALAGNAHPRCILNIRVNVGSDRNGAGRRTRTPDLLITNQLLYRLSYTGVSNRTRIL